MSGLQLPGQGPQTQFFHTPTPFAAPAVATFGLNGGSRVVTQSFGGFTKLERAAIEIAAGMCARVSDHAPIHGSDEEIASRAVAVAQAVLSKVRETEPGLHGSM